GEYIGGFLDCVHFSWDALRQVGILPTDNLGVTYDSVMPSPPSWNEGWVKKAAEKWNSTQGWMVGNWSDLGWASPYGPLVSDMMAEANPVLDPRTIYSPKQNEIENTPGVRNFGAGVAPAIGSNIGSGPSPQFDARFGSTATPTGYAAAVLARSGIDPLSRKRSDAYTDRAR